MKRLHAIVDGRVQGVFFRDFVREQAQALRLTGWVRNLADGTVEVMAEGEDVALNHLLMMLEKGPSRARVDDVQSDYRPPTGEFSDFQVRH
ncbi:MAG TPA: acylphosphatase [Armatimonadota bacterium]